LVDLGIGLVRLAAVDAFVRLAVGTQTAFDRLDEPESEAALLDARFRANRAFDTLFRHFPIFVGDFSHSRPLGEMLAFERQRYARIVLKLSGIVKNPD